MPPSRKLVAFDFDHTIVDGNTDIHIKNLAPNGAIPEEIKRKYSDRCWIDYMGQIFVYLHSHGISASDYQNCLASLPLTAGMRELLNHLKSQNAELIIVSDSNSEFIRMSLEQHQLADNFHSVITNPASFAPTGLLEIRYCHEQNWCDLSTDNMCKGFLLAEYIKNRANDGVNFDQILYVGDGTNDFCPGLKLASTDVFCVRKGFKLESMLNSHEERRNQLKAEVCFWESAEELLKFI